MNLFNDLKLHSSLKYVENSDEFFKREKYYNYPLQEINIRSISDSTGNLIPSPFSRASTRLSRADNQDLTRYTTTKIPNYVKYCIDLVLGEIGQGNIMNCTKKYQQAKDLSMVII
jgi:hypothetical protein